MQAEKGKGPRVMNDKNKKMPHNAMTWYLGSLMLRLIVL